MNIYVGNLPKSVENEELEGLFAEYGEVDQAKVISDRYSGESRGFGFVEMTSDDDANQAIEALDGKEYKGRPLTVNKARERRPRHDNRGGGGGGYNRGGGGGGYNRGGGGGGGRRY